MVRCCCVKGCRSSARYNSEKNTNGNLRFFNIPSIITHHNDESTFKLSKERRECWINSIRGEGWNPGKSCTVCSDHFISGKPAALYDDTSPDWVPTLKLGPNKRAGKDVQWQHISRRKKFKNDTLSTISPAGIDRLMTAEMQVYEETWLPEQIEEDIDDNDKASEPGMVEVQTQTIDSQTLESKIEAMTRANEILQAKLDIKTNQCAELEQQNTALMQDNINLRCELLDTKKENQSLVLGEECFRNDDGKLAYYTGLPSWDVFSKLFDIISANLTGTPKLSKYCRVLMFLMKLRLNLNDQDIGYRFNCHESTVSRNFHAVLKIIIGKSKLLADLKIGEISRLTKPAIKMQIETMLRVTK